MSARITEAMVEAGVTAALNADIIPLKEGYPGVRIEDYLGQDISPGDAIDLGVKLTEKDADGKPRFHWLDYCHADEWDDIHRAILRPVIRAALAAALSTEPGEVLVPKAALDWLNGEGPDPAGLWFGEFPDDYPQPPGKYWWRNVFSDMCALPAAPLPTDTHHGR